MSPISNDSECARKRARNYTAEEEILLADLVEDHKDILLNKKSDLAIWNKKKEVWKKIEEKFAATMGIRRDWKALRDKYVMLRRKCRTELAEQKSETHRTGDGVSTANMSVLSAKIASMLDDSTTGLQNNIDSDYSLDDENYKVIEIEAENNDEDHINDIKCEEYDSTEQNTDSSSWKPDALKQPTSKELSSGAKRKRIFEEEKMELVLLQQQFYREENIRAQEKHAQEMLSLKLKNEILQLELTRKLNKKS